ncbi:MAG: hypothetical protein ACU0GG_11275 [Paracoccaceae bacterium]
MQHPLSTLTRALKQRRDETRTRRAIAQVEADPHLARDVGLKHRPQPKRKITLW